VKLVSNPPNPWASVHADWLGDPPEAKLEVFEESARSIIAENDSPDLFFRFSVNPYRGCFGACLYCYARPTHQYIDFGAGTDFERKIVAKVNAPELLRRELSRRSWRGDTIVFSGVTDCYQPLEAVYGLTRRCLEVCEQFGNPVAIITKGSLVRRDINLLTRLDRMTPVSICVSIAFADDAMARLVEPGTPPPSHRFETLRLLAEAGLRTGISLAPTIPGLNDGDIAGLLQRAKAAGARFAFQTLVRLPAEVLPVFEERLQRAFPDRARKVFHAIEDVRGGKRNESSFGKRMHGIGPRWDAVSTLFRLECRRLGLNDDEEEERPSGYRRPSPQASLFGEPESTTEGPGRPDPFLRPCSSPDPSSPGTSGGTPPRARRSKPA
jgi:DNA repair photolyase